MNLKDEPTAAQECVEAPSEEEELSESQSVGQPTMTKRSFADVVRGVTSHE